MCKICLPFCQSTIRVYVFWTLHFGLYYPLGYKGGPVVHAIMSHAFSRRGQLPLPAWLDPQDVCQVTCWAGTHFDEGVISGPVFIHVPFLERRLAWAA